MDNIIGWSIQAELIQNYNSILPKPFTDGMVLVNSQTLINTVYYVLPQMKQKKKQPKYFMGNDYQHTNIKILLLSLVETLADV